MQITLYSGFKKRENSTLLPPASTTAVPRLTLTGTLKDPCSITAPIIEFQTMTGSPHTYTYAHIPIFGRYYFVTDWKWETRLWTVYLKVDTLASYRTDIMNSYGYVERCAGTRSQADASYDGSIIDTLYPTKTTQVIENTAINAPWTGWEEEDGTYVVGIIQQRVASTAGGAVTYYAMDDTEIFNLFYYLLSDNFYSSIGFPSVAAAAQQLTQETAKALINPLQYIVSCMWFPCLKTKFNLRAATQIKIGPWPINVTGQEISQRVSYREWVDITLPSHPQSATRGEYLNFAPYTQHIFFAPPFGSFTIDPALILNHQVELMMTTDGITGICGLDVLTNINAVGQKQIYHADGMIGVPIPLAQVTTDRLRQITSGITGIASAVTGITSMAFGSPFGPLSLAHGISSLGDSVRASYPTVQSSGVAGSFINSSRLGGLMEGITSKFNLLVDEDSAEYGRPLCQVRQLGTLTGFVKCTEATVDYAAFDEEKRIILNHLLTGFFMD